MDVSIIGSHMQQLELSSTIDSSSFPRSGQPSTTEFNSDSSDSVDFSSPTAVSSGHWGSVIFIICLVDKNVAFTVGEDECLLVWNLANGLQYPGRYLLRGSVTCLCCMPDHLVVGRAGSRNLLLVPLNELLVASMTNNVNCDYPLPIGCSELLLSSAASCLSPVTNNRVLVGCQNGAVLDVSIPVGKEASSGRVRTLLRGARASCVELLHPFGSDGRFLMRRLNETVQMVLRVLGANSLNSRRHGYRSFGYEVDMLPGHTRPARACSIGSSVLLMHACSSMGCLDLLLLGPNGNVEVRIEGLKCHNHRLTAVSCLRDVNQPTRSSSTLLATGSDDGEVKTWLAKLIPDAARMEIKMIWSNKLNFEITALDFVQVPGKAEQILLVGDRDGCLKIY